MSEDLLHEMSDKACIRAWQDEGWGPYHMRLLTMQIKIENNGWKKRNGMTQNQKILKHIQKNGSISQREAIMDYSVQSLTKRIAELRQAGHKIVTLRKLHPVTKQVYARYTLNAA